ncbi:hypothetical protein AMELA_G00182130 [Ameiurus melas]|uniref:Uncharacterized protein n=1 Tax=Ameiurus melas TaxID=219545 RepID=A0A7J6AA48_AMEME|nr:hypothetical protein AMELA_G00182130 [Ameiurus melas]
MAVCVCVCVCVRERERQREIVTHALVSLVREIDCELLLLNRERDRKREGEREVTAQFKEGKRLGSVHLSLLSLRGSFLSFLRSGERGRDLRALKQRRIE